MEGREQALEEALEAVRSRGLDPESPGGAVALDFLLGSPSSGTSAPSADTAHAAEDKDPTAAVARWSGLAPSRVQDLFEFSDESSTVRVPAARLPRSRADKQRILVLLKLAADRIAFATEEVSSSDVSAVVADYGCLDQNLPQNVAGRSNFISRRGKRGAYRYRITQPGLERAQELVSDLGTNDEELHW